jgi:hypothetical protein
MFTTQPFNILQEYEAMQTELGKLKTTSLDILSSLQARPLYTWETEADMKRRIAELERELKEIDEVMVSIEALLDVER